MSCPATMHGWKAEFAVAGVLSLYKKLDTLKEQQKNHQWLKQRDLPELNGKTVCIISCGDVGKECAKRFAAFGCRIVEVHRDLQNLAAYKTADVVIVTMALTERTRHLIKLSAMQQGAVLVNISRGAVVDQDDSTKTLQNGKISAVLDVFEEEPLNETCPSGTWKMCSFTPTTVSLEI